jgi:hypothetical protein
LIQQQKQFSSKKSGLDMIRAPYMPKITPISSRGEIIFLSQMAIRTTTDGLLIADIAVTGPAGPPFVKAIFKETIPRQAIFPLIKPIIIKPH